jgi:hypothetical protein
MPSERLGCRLIATIDRVPLHRVAIAAWFVYAPSLFGASYYVDCAGGDDGASGRDAASAWRTLEKLNQREFVPGDAIRLKRGATCEGMLWPKGSGAAGNPITLGPYGAGATPVVKADGRDTAVRLLNQHDWEIRGIEAAGSTEYGVHVSGTGLARLRLIDCVVHGVNSTGKMTAKASGLVVFDGELDDVVVDGVTAYDTNRWAGIILQGRRGADNVAVRNSTVHNVYGDGIVLFAVRDGLIERSAAWYTGMEPSYSIGTPNSIWTWSCAHCVVRETEGFYSDSPGVDGGVYDIDWGDSDNLVEDNYGHDSQAYCVSVFGAGSVTAASEVRGNVCAGTGRSPRAALHHGDVFVYTWNKGSLDGVRIHDNTLLWNPPIDSPVLKIDAEFSGNGANSFDHNLIESSVPWMVDASSGRVSLDGNSYVYPGDGRWIWNGLRFEGLAGFQKVGGQEAKGSAARTDPGLLRTPRHQPLAPELTAARVDWKALRGHYALVGFLDSSPDSRGETVVLGSAAAQYGRILKTIAISPAKVPAEWNFEGVQAVTGPSPKGKLPLTFLVDPDGRMLYRWEGYSPAKEIVFAIRKLCGPPSGPEN